MRAQQVEKLDSSLEKGLCVLELLNQHVSVRIRDLHDWTGIPKSTLVRILKTLQEAGFVRKLSRSSGYSLSSRVMALSSGFHGTPMIVDKAAPFLDDLTRRKLWPASLASLDYDAMIVRYSTIPISPYSHKQSTMQRRLSLALRAHGRAYLAHCPKPELLSLLRPMAEDVVKHLKLVLPTFRRQGWALRHPALDPQTGSIAVPLMTANSQVLGTIGFTYFRRGVDRDQERQLAEELLATARLIVRSL